jgi:hypothetical protein
LRLRSGVITRHQHGGLMGLVMVHGAQVQAQLLFFNGTNAAVGNDRNTVTGAGAVAAVS